MAFFREIDSSASCILDNAACTVILTSRGRAAVVYPPGTGEALWMEAGGLLLCSDSVEITPASECHLLAIGFSGTAAQEFGSRLSRPLLSDCNACPLAAQEMSALAAAVARDETELLPALAFRVLCSVSKADEAEETPGLPPLVAQAVLAIRQNYAGLYGVDELARQLGVSKSHLVRVFTAQMGTGPGQYLIQTRIEAAKVLLAQRDYSLEVIASLCGFSGANYLCKVFKKHTGQTPGMFRALHIGASPSPVHLSELEGALYT